MTCWRRLAIGSCCRSGTSFTACCWQPCGRPGSSICRWPSWTVAARGQSGAVETGQNPTDRRKPGTKQHLLVDRNGIGGASHHGSEPHDVHEIIPLVSNTFPPLAASPATLFRNQTPCRPTTLPRPVCRCVAELAQNRTTNREATPNTAVDSNQVGRRTHHQLVARLSPLRVQFDRKDLYLPCLELTRCGSHLLAHSGR